MHIFAFILLFAQTYAFFLSINKTAKANSKSSHNSTILNELIIDYPVNSMEKFPVKFSINLTNIKTNEFNVISFIRIPRNGFEHPIASSRIFTWNENVDDAIKIRENSTQTSDNFESYKQEGSDGFATLILNEESEYGHKYRMVGTVYSKVFNNTAYDIIPISLSQSDSNSSHKTGKNYNSRVNSHIINKRKVSYSKFCDVNYVMKMKNGAIRENFTFQNTDEKRHRRSLNGDPIRLYVELLLVTDRTIFLDHQALAKTNDTNLIFLNMKIYYSHFFNGVNQHYQNSLSADPDLRISIKLKNFIFFTRDVDFTNSSMHGVPGIPTYNGREVLQAGLVLDAFSSYMNFLQNLNLIPFTYDVALSTMDKDLWGSTSLNTASVVGLSYVTYVCTNYRYAIMEDINGFAYISVASHEIGHLLGAYHDGAATPSGYSQCLASDGNIMSPAAIVVNAYNQYVFTFSSCSIKAFKSNLLNSNLNAVLPKAQCLTNIPTVNLTNVTNQLWDASDECVSTFGNNPLFCSYPGQIWSADDQCKMRNGNGSYFCSTDSSQLCVQLWCGNYLDSSCSTSGGVAAAEGTSCGSGAICVQNQCTNSSVAPVATCVSNVDQLIFQSSLSGFQIPYSPMTCDAYLSFLYSSILINNGLGCSNSFVKTICCNACINLFWSKEYQDVNVFDAYLNCPSVKQYCLSTSVTFSDGTLISTACPRTCNHFQGVKCKGSQYLCQNGGTCSNITLTNNSSVIAFQCNCPIGYYGFLCELKNSCIPNPCQNNGVCSPIGSLGKYYCTCPKSCSSDFNCAVCNSSTISNSANTKIQSTSTLSNQVTVYIPIVGTSSVNTNQSHISNAPSNPPTSTTQIQTIKLIISFNSVFVSDYNNLESAASQLFINNFKNFLVSTLNPAPVNIIVQSLSAGSIITNSNLQFNTSVSASRISNTILAANPPQTLGSIGSVSADVQIQSPSSANGYTNVSAILIVLVSFTISIFNLKW